jgi:hypothetical protein
MFGKSTGKKLKRQNDNIRTEQFNLPPHPLPPSQTIPPQTRYKPK